MYVLVFQEGHLNRLLHITTTGNVYIVAPILIGNLAFGLALDYQVFILSRIREEYERSGDHTTAIARGLGFSGPIISAAALLIAMVFLGSGIMSSATVLKGVGFGLAVTVLFDAFVIRATLVPAVMHLLGTRVWWAPAWLSRLTERLGTAHAAPGPPVELARAHVPIKNGVLDGTADCALESSQSRGRS
jgi:RND superfamily putative drug exporter